MSLEKLKKALKEEQKLIFGSKETLKNIKLGRVKIVFLANNCPEEVRDSIIYYSKISKIEVIELNLPNDELAMVCKKNYPISVISSY